MPLHWICLWSFLVQQVEKCVERESGHILCHYDEQDCLVSCDSGDRWALCQQLHLGSRQPLTADRLSLKPFMCVISFWAQLCRIGPPAPHRYLLESFLIVVPGWPFQKKRAARTKPLPGAYPESPFLWCRQSEESSGAFCIITLCSVPVRDPVWNETGNSFPPRISLLLGNST